MMTTENELLQATIDVHQKTIDSLCDQLIAAQELAEERLAELVARDSGRVLLALQDIETAIGDPLAGEHIESARSLLNAELAAITRAQKPLNKVQQQHADYFAGKLPPNKTGTGHHTD